VFAPQGGVGTAETNIANLLVNCTVGTSRRIRVDARVAGIVPTTNTGVITLGLKIDGVSSQYAEHHFINSLGNVGVGLYVSLITNTLSAGAHSFIPTIYIDSGTVTVHAGSNRGGYCLVEDIGPVSLA